MEPTLYLACILGIASRTILPYLIELKKHPETKFDRKFLVPALIAVLINLFIAPAIFQSMPAGVDWFAAYMVGWGSTDISRNLQKLGGSDARGIEEVG